MKVDILASGSNGNVIVLTSGNASILIDCGIAKTLIEKKLMNVGINSGDVEAIFITHAHGDHIKGLPISNKYNIPVYASEGEWKKIKGVDNRRMTKVGYSCGLHYPFKVTAFKTHHDSFEPLGYVAVDTEASFKTSVCLDTGIVDETMLDAMKGSDVYIIESNHDREMVESSSYPNSVKARILSHVGHLSNQQTADALFRLIKGKGERIYLTHLSDKNNFPMLAKMTVMKKLREKGFIDGKDYYLEVM